ncbi:hypothetical protein HY522_04100 [bacterium]|nr:hypothetical protein [bacterium]
MAERLKVFVIHGRGATPRHPDAREEGGDLDTVSSNAFYGAWATQLGVPHELAFVQYHEGLLRNLGEFENADLYIPDLPLDTIPDLEGDIRELGRRGSRIVHFLDHHPWSDWQVDLLNRLKSEGLIERYALAGARKGEQLPKEAQACGAELVHDAVIRDGPCDTDGLRELRRITRQQDLNTGEDPLGVRLSKLIGYGYSKHAMATALKTLKEPEDLPRLFQALGWEHYVAEHDERISRVLPRLKRSLCEIRFKPAGTDEDWNIVCCLVPKVYEHEPLPNVAAAMRYLKDFVQMDYFFYCYGSRALTTRKATTRPGAINLGALVEKICAPRDGGHPEAASGRPQANWYFPRERLTYISGRNFIWYCRYLAQRIRTATGVRIESTHPLRVS